ncbi:MAG: DUF1638 domain-containing protein [Phycisphaerae bacterium]|nr:DUF1638 domain-containing protein [Phycisphaerae bacterium]
MRLQFVICKVLQREAYFCAARSKNIVDIVTLPQGLHDTPDTLRKELQAALEKCEDVQGRKYDAHLLGYGMCSNGIVGIEAKQIPIVVPRGHDCITLLLGSKERYKEYFDSHRGTYWYSDGWIETNAQPGKERYEKTLGEYREKYGDDNAEHLMEMEQNWMKEYQWATYIDWGLAGSEEHKKYTKQCAEFMHWNYDEIKGDSSLMQRLIDGNWQEQEVLVVKPGQKIIEDLTTPGLITAQ